MAHTPCGRHRRARLSLRARETIETGIAAAVAGVLAAAILGGLVWLTLSVVPSGRACAPIVVESTGTWQHDHAAQDGPDPDWGTFDCVEVTGLSTREDLSHPVDMSEVTP